VRLRKTITATYKFVSCRWLSFIDCPTCCFKAQIKEVLAKDAEIRRLAEELSKERSLLIMGRGYNYATCLEGALVSDITFVRGIVTDQQSLLNDPLTCPVTRCPYNCIDQWYFSDCSIQSCPYCLEICIHAKPLNCNFVLQKRQNVVSSQKQWTICISMKYLSIIRVNESVNCTKMNNINRSVLNKIWSSSYYSGPALCG